MKVGDKLIIAWFAAAVLHAAQLPAHAQRAVQSPLMVTVARTKSSGTTQQIGLKITIRNMSKNDVDMRLEALFIATGGSRSGQEGIYCERKTSAQLKGGESRDFTTESDAPSSGYYVYNGSYYYYSSMKVRGYMTRVFADGQLVNVTASVPSIQKAGWDEKEMAKLGYSGGEVPNGTPPRQTATLAAAPQRTDPIPDTDSMSRTSAPPVPGGPSPSAATLPGTPDATPAVGTAPVPKAAPAASTYDAAVYERTAKLYNDSIAAYQAYLKNRTTPAALKRIEADLQQCSDDFAKIESGAPASLNIPGIISNCRKTIFAIHGTMQAQP